MATSSNAVAVAVRSLSLSLFIVGSVFSIPVVVAARGGGGSWGGSVQP